MSAEMLRRAADGIRADWERENVHDVSAAEFHIAVADWLDYAADLAEASPSFDRRLIRQRAVAVAAAYLGESDRFALDDVVAELGIEEDR